MSMFRFEEMTCPLCGKTFSASVIMSYSTNGALRSLDGDPYVPELFNMVHLCPHCGYVFSDPEAKPDGFTRIVVRGENYRKILQAEGYPETAKKLLLEAYLLERQGHSDEACFKYLHAYWYFRDQNLSEKEEALDHAIQTLKRYLERNADRNSAMVLVDLLRQKGAFEEALETVNSLGRFLQGEETLLKVGAFEWRLIMAEDNKPHVFGEVEHG